MWSYLEATLPPPAPMRSWILIALVVGRWQTSPWAARPKKVPKTLCFKQCSGSMTFWCGSDSADPCLCLMDPNPAIFIIDLQEANKQLIFYRIFCFMLFEGTFKIQSFSYYFCLMIEGYRSIPLTSGSGSGRPQNMWMQLFRIRIRIQNTGFK